MSTTKISRRTFIAGSAATALAASIPAAPARAAPLPPAPKAPADGSWGYTLDGERWYTGFKSMAQAMDEANADIEEDCTFEVGYCVADPLYYPDVNDKLAEWLDDSRGSLGAHLRDWFHDANEEHEFEGALGDEIDRAPTGELETAVRSALDAALVRAGVPALWLAGTSTGDDHFAVGMEDGIAPSILRSIENDLVLRDEVTAAYKAWVASNRIEDAPRTISTRDVHTVTATYDEERDEFELGEPVPETGRAPFAPTP